MGHDRNKRIAFGIAPIVGTDDKMLFMGIPKDAWEQMQDGVGHDIDLTKIGIPFKLVIFGADSHDSAISFITATLNAQGIPVHDRRHDDFSIDNAERVAEQTEFEEIPAAPVDRTAVTLTDGSPVTEDHTDLKPNGQQKAYVVLSAEERAKGFARPYRDAYRHATCNTITTMGRSIAETFAREPTFYSGTFCTECKGHFPVGPDGEFTWYEMDGTEGPKVGT